jgi:ABC-2 type transport system permease protein
MTRSITWVLVRKDLFLYRWLIGGTLVAGIASLFLAGTSGGLRLPGEILLVTSLVVLGAFLAIHGVITERQTRSLLFALSLPISPMQYTVAKLTGGLLAFLIPWLACTGLIVAFAGTDGAARAPVSVVLTLLGLLLTNFCVLSAIGIGTGSELWSVAGIIATNTSVPVFMISVMPRIEASTRSAGIPWTTTVALTLGAEALLALLSLAYALYRQSRRTDFV